METQEKTNQVVETTKKSDYMFNITDARNEELTKMARPSLDQYSNGDISNCQLVQQLIDLTEDQNEKYYLAYQAGVHVESESNNPFGF